MSLSDLGKSAGPCSRTARRGFLDATTIDELSSGQKRELEQRRRAKGCCAGCGRPARVVEVLADRALLECRSCRTTWSAAPNSRAYKAAKLAAGNVTP